MKQTIITICFCLGMLIFASSAMASDPGLSSNTFNVNFPIPTERSLDEGHIDEAARTNVHAIEIRVNGGDEGQSWKLYVRAENSIFSPGVYGKPCGDLKWKFDNENANSYRRVRTNNQLVASGSGKTNVTKYIDLRMLLDWSDSPAAYSLGLTFTLKAE